MQKDKISKTKDKGIARTQCSKANFWLKNHLQRLHVLLTDFHPKKCPIHPLTWRKVGQRWGLRNIINEGIATKKLTKTNPIHPLHLKGWVGQLIIINKVQCVTSMILNMRFNIPICIFLPRNYNFLLLYDVNSFCISIFIVSPNVFPPSTLTCTCSSIFSLRANASTSSTLACIFFQYFHLEPMHAHLQH